MCDNQINKLYFDAVGQVIAQLQSAIGFFDIYAELVGLYLLPWDGRHQDKKRYSGCIDASLRNASEKAQSFRELFQGYPFFGQLRVISVLTLQAQQAQQARCHLGYGSELKALIESTIAELKSIQSLIGNDSADEISGLLQEAAISKPVPAR